MPQLICPSGAGYTPQIFHWTVFFCTWPQCVYILFILCFSLCALSTKNQNQNQRKRRKGRGTRKKKQTSFLTALVKNAKKPRRNEAKERIEKQKKTYIRKKLTTSKWQRSVHKFLKCPQQANVKPKTKLKTKSKRRNKPNEMQSKMHFKRTALSRASRVGSRESRSSKDGTADGFWTRSYLCLWYLPGPTAQWTVPIRFSAICLADLQNMALTCAEGSPRKKKMFKFI